MVRTQPLFLPPMCGCKHLRRSGGVYSFPLSLIRGRCSSDLSINHLEDEIRDVSCLFLYCLNFFLLNLSYPVRRKEQD